MVAAALTSAACGGDEWTPPTWAPSDEAGGPPFCGPGGDLFGSDKRDAVDFPGLGKTLGMGGCGIASFGPCGGPLMTHGTYGFGVRMMRTTWTESRDWRIESSDTEVAHAEQSSPGGTCGFSVRIETSAPGPVELVAYDGDFPLDRFRLEVVDGAEIAVMSSVHGAMALLYASVRAADGEALEVPTLRWRLANLDVLAFADFDRGEQEPLAEWEGASAFALVRGEGVAEGSVSHPSGLEAPFTVTVP